MISQIGVLTAERSNCLPRLCRFSAIIGALAWNAHFHDAPFAGSEKGGLLEKGLFSGRSVSRDSGEFRDSRVLREPPDCGK